MAKGLSEREREAVRALSKSSSEALVATVMYMREREAKRLETKASTK
ncbi:MAG: hypothetical protein JRN06_12575 [Nitrososphaerota archaeon]|nr:hypothetical protein [Nitrososphaerota archaeon]